MSVSTLHTYTAMPTVSSNQLQIGLSSAPAAGDLEVAVIAGHSTSGTCQTITVPNGWTLYDSKCVDSDADVIWTLTHVATGGEASYTFNFSGSDYYSAVVYDLSGANTAAPVDGHTDQIFASGTQQQTASLTPTQNGDLAIATFANGHFVADPSIASPFTHDDNADGAVYETTAHDELADTSPVQATASYSTAPAFGISNIILIASTTASKLHTYTATPTVSSSQLQINLSPPPPAGDLEVAVIAGHSTSGTCQTITVPTGWTLYDSKCVDSDADIIWTLTHVATGSEGSYTFTFSGSDYYSAIVYDLTGASTTAPVDGHADQVFTSGSQQQTASLAPTQSGDLALATFANGHFVADPSIAAPFTADANADGAVYETTAHLADGASSEQATATYSSAPGLGISNIILIAPAHGNAPLTTYPYNPSYIYFGTATNGGGGDDCGGTYCTSGSVLNQLNVRYVEGGALSGTWAANSVCQDGAYCHPIYYNKINNIQCTEGSFTNSVYEALDSHDSSSSDPGFTHYNTPAPGATWAPNRTGQAEGSQGVGGPALCPSPGPVVNNYGTYADPADTGSYLSNAENTYWFTAGGGAGLGSDVNLYTRWDNSTLVNSTVEYGGGSFTALNNYIKKYAAFFAQFSYPQGFNNGGHGGPPFQWNNPGASGSRNIAFSCNNGVCNDMDDWCASATTYFKFFQFERPTTPGPPYDGSSRIQNNVPYILNTLSHVYNDAGCGNVDVVFLDQTYSTKVGGTSAGDDRYYRDTSLALRVLTERGTYNGTQNAASVLDERYADCASNCSSQVTVMPEDGIQFLPLDNGMQPYSGSTKDGNGCASGDAGGARTFRVYCDAVNNDDQGTEGAVYARAGTCYKFGTDIGTCVVLLNEANADEPIQDGWCKTDGLTTPCSAYPKYWHYAGTGPQTCYEDQGTNLGTTGASCTGATICPAANGCQGAWGENNWNGTATLPGVTAANTLGACPGPLDDGGTGGSPTYQTKDCMVLLLSQ